MHPLSLSPLPSIRNEDETISFQNERGSFVDEDAVAQLVNGPRYPRSTPSPNDLILSVDDMDFAGWQLSSAPTPRAAEVPPQVINAIIRRATPPMICEPGIGTPHLGSHRWWLAGLAGVLSTLLFSLLLLTLAQRPSGASRSSKPFQFLSRAQEIAAPPASPARTVSELTASSPNQH